MAVTHKLRRAHVLALFAVVATLLQIQLTSPVKAESMSVVYWSKSWFAIYYGQQFSTSTPLPGNNVNYYWKVGGPCYNKMPCYIDTLNVVYLNGSWVESVTAYGRYWNFDLYTKAPWSSNASTLKSVARYGAYPCSVPFLTAESGGATLIPFPPAGQTYSPHQGYPSPACFSGRIMYLNGAGQFREDLSVTTSINNNIVVRHWVFDLSGKLTQIYDTSAMTTAPGGGRSRP